MKLIGTYITLGNGRVSPEEHLITGHGIDGPTFGPFESVQIVYGEHIKCWAGGKVVLELYTSKVGLTVYKGVFYSDLTIFAGEQEGDTVKKIGTNWTGIVSQY
jgi:hypothetical protein